MKIETVGFLIHLVEFGMKLILTTLVVTVINGVLFFQMMVLCS